MLPTQQSTVGGRFLTTSIGPADVFTREDLTDEQRLFGRAAAEFMRGEVLPREARLTRLGPHASCCARRAISIC
jgi:hypothetical protein